MELEKSIRLTVDSGDVVLGASKALKNALNGSAKLVLVAANCPRGPLLDLRRFCELSKTPLVQYAGSSVELGRVCGKPFPVSALSVLEEGDSDILQAAKTA